MRWGLRVQLLLLLGALMVVGFLPLFFASSTYTKIALGQVQRDGAARLAESMAHRISQVQAGQAGDEQRALLGELSAHVQTGAVLALFIYDAENQPRAGVGPPTLVEQLRQNPPKAPQRTITEIATQSGPALLVITPVTSGVVSTVVPYEPEQIRAGQLEELMGLYIAIAALSVLVIAYFALTRWIVRPVLALERAAERVAAGGRVMTPLNKAPAELARLSQSLGAMTESLRQEEEALRAKINEVSRATEELRQTQSSLVRSERLASVGRLAAGLAHEVGNPLSALMGMQDLLLDGGLTAEENRDFLERMKKETSRIHRVLGDLLAFSRAGQKRSPTKGKAEPGLLSEALSDLVSLLGPQRDFKAIKLALALDDDLPAVPLEHEELMQVALNLVMNAADACKQKGNITLSAKADREHGGVIFTVEDTGPGISKDVEATLFEPFVSTKEVGKGTGLGLAVTRGLIESAGGTIVVDPSYTDGARFVIHLPTAEPSSFK